MGLFETIRRHSAVATGNFSRIFEGKELKPLPSAAAMLIQEVSKEDPDFDRLSTLLSSTPSIAARVLQTVNVLGQDLPEKVTSLKVAVSLLGVQHTRTIAFAFGTLDALPKPQPPFDNRAYSADCLVRALLAQRLTFGTNYGEPADAFTAALLSDLALPILLTEWGEYYQPILDRWKEGDTPLATLEEEEFGWNHAQAGAWMADKWGFPSMTACIIGAHAFTPEQLDEIGFKKTIALPVVVATRLPSILRCKKSHMDRFIDLAVSELQLSLGELKQKLTETADAFGNIAKLLDLSPDRGLKSLKNVQRLISEKL